MTPAQGPHLPAPAPSKVPRYLLVGCVSVLALLLLAGIAGYFLFWGAVDHLARDLTTERPLAVPPVTASEEEIRAIEKRIENFGSAMEGEAPPEPLVLSAEEINALIQRNSNLQEQRVGAVVRIVGRQIEAEISVPAERLMRSLEGRYLNGKAVLSVGVMDGRVVAYIRDLRVGDHYVPDQIRERISQENLLKGAYEEDSDLARALERIASVEVRDGSLVLVPAPRAAGSTPTR